MLALGKKRSPKPTFRRTTSMSGITIDVGNLEEEAAPPTPIGGDFEHLLSPGYLRKTYSGGFHTETAGFLRICGLCNCRLIPGRDIYMYRGDTAFCSLECREQQIEQDERKERLAAAKSGESHHPELPTATPEPETVAVT